ncbi:MAG: His/Gly/Thr/Pro-type tRNA ligase C-terminal domain-containing protein [Candidatus Paceibacterota bacterium]|jgi:histidyl-tRNA synthetase
MMASPQPNMFYCEKSHKASKLDCSIVSLGSSKSICECLSIETGITILNSLGYKNLEVEINSIGDKESMNEFQKKLAVFVRKNINSFSANLRQAVKKDLCAIFKEKKDECANFDTECPKSIDFLSETSRLHFKEVIEFLEVLDIPYQINPHLVGDLDIGSETVFAIKNDGEELAYGFRFNRLAKKLGCKKDLPATILDISAKLPSSAKTTADKAKKSLKKVKVKNTKPQFYLIQFGPEAKLKSFLILKELYKAGVNVVHTIAKDKLGGQMTTAENSEAPYIILIGQKEALDNSVVIRNTSTRAQETVLIGNLAARAKELAK